MSVKYEILKRLVKAVNIKKMWTGMSTEKLLENRSVNGKYFSRKNGKYFSNKTANYFP
jgi:hypothetical protein